MYFKTNKITFWFESITLFFTCTISFPNPATRARLNVTMRILNREFSLGICNYSDSFHSTYAILFFSVRPSLVVNHNLLCSLRGCIVFGIWRQLAAWWFIVICFSRIFHPFSSLSLFFSAFRTFRLRNVDGLLYFFFRFLWFYFILCLGWNAFYGKSVFYRSVNLILPWFPHGQWVCELLRSILISANSGFYKGEKQSEIIWF